MRVRERWEKNIVEQSKRGSKQSVNTGLSSRHWQYFPNVGRYALEAILDYPRDVIELLLKKLLCQGIIYDNLLSEKPLLENMGSNQLDNLG